MRRFCILLAAWVGLGGVVAPLSPARADEDALRARAASCQPAEHAFTPRSLVIPHVIARTKVLALGRDRHGVPRPPPLSERGKWEFAWDKESRIRPGSRHGTVRLTAHTYPSFAGTALGNRLLARLHTGALIEVSGPGGQRLCYRVVRRVEVPAKASVPAYYSSTGPARLAILVCSGTRRGPGDWTHRTIWFAAPLLAPDYT